MIGFVQAGGGSTRFGQDKALAELGGKTMLVRTTELVAKVCDTAQIVAPAGRYQGAPTVVIEDRYPGEGPLGGIITALSVATTMAPRAEWALIVSCDMPFLTSDFLTFLCRRAETSSKQVIVPASASGLEPLCAVWNLAAEPTIRAAFDSGVRKVTEAMKRLPMEVLDEREWKRFDNENRMFWNMNTPADFEEARRILGETRAS